MTESVWEAVSETKLANAAYDPATAIAASADFTVVGGSGKKNRVISYVQTAGVNPGSKIASVAGNFPITDIPGGYVS